MTAEQAERARQAIRRRTVSLTPLQLRQVRNLVADDLARAERRRTRQLFAEPDNPPVTGLARIDAARSLLVVLDEAAGLPRQCEAQVDTVRRRPYRIVLCAHDAIAGEPYCAEHRERGWR